MGKHKNRLPNSTQSLVQNFEPMNDKQQEFMDLIYKNDITIAAGVAGSGKTIVSLATALDLLGGIYKRIVLVKSVTTIPGEAIGFIPGSVSDKMDPFIMSFT
jgi:predicted ribonuclease YlaK